MNKQEERFEHCRKELKAIIKREPTLSEVEGYIKKLDQLKKDFINSFK